MEISVKNVFLLSIIIFIQSCSWFESDYDKLMNPIKKIKLAERKAGKPNPVFDGVVEPYFPDEKENNKTLEGVDSNHDGVRDDIEIWINRTAEDQYVRLALKDYYKNMESFFQALDQNLTEEQVHAKLSEWTAVGGCIFVLLLPYDKKYLESQREDGGIYYSRTFDNVLFPNSTKRNALIGKWNNFQFTGTIGGNSKEVCPKRKYGERYQELLKKYQN